MRVLFDQGVPVPLRQALSPQHEVSTVYERGWSTLENGELLETAEQEGYDVFVTTDSNLKHQQSLVGRDLGIVVLLSPSWPRVQRVIDSVIKAVGAAIPGSYTEVEIPQ